MPRITNAKPETETNVATEPYNFTCANCKTEVVMSVDEQNWFYNLGYKLPGLCADCRRARRKKRNARRKQRAAMQKAGVVNG